MTILHRLVPKIIFPLPQGPVQYVQADSLPRLPGGKVRKARTGFFMAGQTESPGQVEV